MALAVPLNVAEIEGEAVAPTGSEVTVKVAEVAPAGTVTLAGTVAAEVMLLDKVTTAPPEGAAAVRVTVPVEGVPPVTVVGFKVTDKTAGGLTVSVAPAVPLNVAEIEGEAVAPTGNEVTVKVAEVAPAATVTLAGTVAAEVMLLDKVTTAPPEGAAAVRVTVPVEGVPPVTVVGFKVKL